MGETIRLEWLTLFVGRDLWEQSRGNKLSRPSCHTLWPQEGQGETLRWVPFTHVDILQSMVNGSISQMSKLRLREMTLSLA